MVSILEGSKCLLYWRLLKWSGICCAPKSVLYCSRVVHWIYIDLYWKRHLLESEYVSCLINTSNLYCSHTTGSTVKLYWRQFCAVSLCGYVLVAWSLPLRALNLQIDLGLCAIKEFTELVVDDVISIVLCTSCWQFMTCAVCRYNPYSVQIKKPSTVL